MMSRGGFRVIRGRQKKHRKQCRVFTKISSTVPETRNNLHRENDDTSTPSSLMNERSGRKSSPQSERRNSSRTRAKRTTKRWVGLCAGMLLLLARRARQDGRWQDSIRKEIWPEVGRTNNPSKNIGWVHPNYRGRQNQGNISLERERWKE